MNRRLGAITILLAAVAAAAGLLASTSNGAAQTQPTIGLIVQGPGSPTGPEEENGAKAAAAALGDQLEITENASDPATQISTIKSLVAQHVAAIAVNTDAGPEAVAQIEPALSQARAAGIPTLSYETRYSNSVWVSQSSPAQYAHALGDALASQMKRHGQFITVPCDSGFPIVTTWTHDVNAYVRHKYPRMHRVATVYGGTGNGPTGTLVLRPLLRKYPHLRGFIFICPGEAYTEGPQLVKAHKIGKVFAAGNGGDCPPLYQAYADNVRSGAEEIVCAGDPTHLGYLTIWAADHLASAHTLTFTPGSYDVGGPVGTVQYYARHEELRLGQPLTITKGNVDQYAAP